MNETEARVAVLSLLLIVAGVGVVVGVLTGRRWWG